MTMQDIMGALLQSSGGQQSGGADALGQAAAGALGSSMQSGGGLGGLLGGLFGGGSQNAQTQMLGALEQIIGGKPGTGNVGMNQGTAASLGAGDPMMTLLQPVVTQLAAKANISPQIAMVVVSIALHYLLKSHPSTPGASPLNLGNIMQTLSSGGQVSPDTLQKSGMVSDVVKATGLSQQQAVKSLNQTFNVFGKQVSGVGVKGTARIQRTTAAKPAAKKAVKKAAKKKK
jgi:hypothetical protein